MRNGENKGKERLYANTYSVNEEGNKYLQDNIEGEDKYSRISTFIRAIKLYLIDKMKDSINIAQDKKYLNLNLDVSTEVNTDIMYYIKIKRRNKETSTFETYRKCKEEELQKYYKKALKMKQCKQCVDVIVVKRSTITIISEDIYDM